MAEPEDVSAASAAADYLMRARAKLLDAQQQYRNLKRQYALGLRRVMGLDGLVSPEWFDGIRRMPERQLDVWLFEPVVLAGDGWFIETGDWRGPRVRAVAPVRGDGALAGGALETMFGAAGTGPARSGSDSGDGMDLGAKILETVKVLRGLDDPKEWQERRDRRARILGPFVRCELRSLPAGKRDRLTAPKSWPDDVRVKDVDLPELFAPAKVVRDEFWHPETLPDPALDGPALRASGLEVEELDEGGGKASDVGKPDVEQSDPDGGVELP